jgi:GMP synthase (glutamine-hydrolysing)
MTESTQPSEEYDKVAILDAGSQYAKVIDRRIRELSVYSELIPLQTSVTELLSRNYKAIIISGSPGSVNDPIPVYYDPKLFECGLPILGICYGLQMLNKQRGGTIVRQAVREDGQFQVELDDKECPLFKNMTKLQNVLLTHGDSIEILGDNLNVIGKSESFIVACADKEKPIYGLQFHPEVDLTDNGMEIFKNFLFDIAHCRATFTMGSRIDEAFSSIRSFVKDQIVFVLCSGGVDSSVCAALLTRALPTEQVKIVSIDNGFLRENEGVEIRQTLSQFGAVNYIDASQRFAQAKTFVRAKATTSTNESTANAQRRTSMSSNFLSLYDADVLLEETLPLNEEIDPEHKRKIIGDTFVKVVQEFLRDNNFTFDDIVLAQGTLRPDLIESASHLASQGGHADAIKTHHNDSPMVRELRKRNRVIEPLKDFHKDEVRQIGLTLGLHPDVIHRHPFPGPGLAIRILCADEPYMPIEQFSQTSTLLRTIVTYSTMVEKQYALLPTLDKIFTENEKILLKTLTSPEQHDYTSVVLPVSLGILL